MLKAMNRVALRIALSPVEIGLFYSASQMFNNADADES
jgi:hypothetical protein